MKERYLADFSEAIEWNLVARQTYTAPATPTPYLNRLPNRTFLIENSSALIIGLNSQSARSNWFTGGWASQLLLFLPSSTTEFTATVEASSKLLRLRRLNFVMFPRIMPTWLLELRFPYWLNDVYVEVWRYDGTDLSIFDRLDQLEANLSP